MSPDGGDALWYKDAIIYEIHVRAFFDSNSDGKGDFRGLTQKLDYIQDLGATAVWLLPFYPSPWRDDGYDISDYTGVHPAYGTLRNFQSFLAEAHRRGLHVITELILNHTSDQHPWFQRARRARSGSRQRDFYVWSDTPEKYKEARIIFNDFQTSNWTWDPMAKAYYWHRFYAHQPDLNFDHPLVRRAMFRVVDFWLDQGVDGFRLDAVPYLFEREGTNCEHLPETHAFLRELRRHIDSKYKNRMLLAEANLWPEDALAYLSGDECHMSFHFPLMPRLFTANRMEDRFPIMEILRQTPPIPETCQWALFLRNHDELTLEMVTDEERDYMYRMYAQDPQTRINLGIRRRLAPLLENDRRRIELMNALLLSLPGTPVVYYGDEIGMGDNVYLGDRNGVRTPMQWSMDRNAGFSQANPQQLYLPVNIDPEYHYEAVNVEIQQNISHSLLWWMKRLVSIRKQFRAFGRGALEFLQPENRKVLVFARKYQGERILVAANLSRFVQAVGLDLAEFKGLTPVEMLGRTELPTVAEGLYHITLSPYAFYWLSFEDRSSSIEALPGAPEAPTAVFQASSWTTLFDPPLRPALEQFLPRFLNSRRWFKGRNRRVESMSFPDIIHLRPASAYILITRVEYADGDAETYALFASFATGEEMARVQTESPAAVTAHLRAANGMEGILYSALWDESFARTLMEAFPRRRRFKGEAGELAAFAFRSFREISGVVRPALEPVVGKGGATNNSFVFGERFILKLFRHVESGIHPELEMGRFLTERTSFTNVAPIAGGLEYLSSRGESTVVGVLHAFVKHEADAWHFTLDSLSRFFERTQTSRSLPDDSLFGADGANLITLSAIDAPATVHALIGEYLESSRLLGQRTAELHIALAGDAVDADFRPEPLSRFYRQGFYHGVLALTTRLCQTLRGALETLPERVRIDARRVLGHEEDIRTRLRLFRDSEMTGLRIRVHGNYSLSDVLYTGKDFIIVDFEGEPTRHLTERRIKRPPLYDVASMLVSLHDAVHAGRLGQMFGHVNVIDDAPLSFRWAECWYRWVAASFLKGYMGQMGSALLLPGAAEDKATLLNTVSLERFIAQADNYSGLNPDALSIPLTGILGVVADWSQGDNPRKSEHQRSDSS
jgi:maltose alpha-D-glucosyltransferase/alpha-amylase